MSEKQKSNYCRWCDTLGNSSVREYDNGVLIWSGCPDCFIKKKERKNNA